MPDLVVRDARLVLPRGIVKGELSIDNGVIKKIAVAGAPKGEMELDAKGKLVIPGVIDAHAHVYDPKFVHRENFKSGSTSAAAGGVTTIIVMPWDTPVLSPADVKNVVAAGEKNSLVDFSVHAGNFTPEAIPAVRRLSSLGVKSFKGFTCAPYRLSQRDMGRLMAAVRKADGTTFVHAEDDKIVGESQAKLIAEGRSDPLAHHEARSGEAEKKAVRAAIEIASESECRLHLAHITTGGACDVIKAAKRKNKNVTAEVTTHHLVFSRSDVQRLGPYLKVNPSLKGAKEREHLWKALASGVIDIVVTDHAPGTREEKEVGWKDIWRAQTGVPGLETLLPILLGKGVAEGRLKLERMVDAASTRPAKIFGLYPRKGVIAKGSDADLVVVDARKSAKINAKHLHYKVGWTPYEGMKVTGTIAATVSRGELIFDGEQVTGKKGRGRALLSGHSS
ncbi:MAG: dihydroorotase family protein [Candidatus Hadarchaeota archaeon]